MLFTFFVLVTQKINDYICIIFQYSLKISQINMQQIQISETNTKLKGQKCLITIHQTPEFTLNTSLFSETLNIKLMVVNHQRQQMDNYHKIISNNTLADPTFHNLFKNIQDLYQTIFKYKVDYVIEHGKIIIKYDAVLTKFKLQRQIIIELERAQIDEVQSAKQLMRKFKNFNNQLAQKLQGRLVYQGFKRNFLPLQLIKPENLQFEPLQQGFLQLNDKSKYQKVLDCWYALFTIHEIENLKKFEFIVSQLKKNVDYCSIGLIPNQQIQLPNPQLSSNSIVWRESAQITLKGINNPICLDTNKSKKNYMAMQFDLQKDTVVFKMENNFTFTYDVEKLSKTHTIFVKFENKQSRGKIQIKR